MKTSQDPRWPGLVLLALLPLSAFGQTEFRGWVRDATTGLPVEGARVTLDLEPADNVVEYGRTTAAFGFFRIPAVANGTYAVRVQRRGYTPHASSVNVAGDTVRQTIRLTPLPGGPTFDLQVQVGDVTTGLLLANVPVSVQRFVNPGDALPAEILTALTDTNGFASFPWMSAGHYRFRANHPADAGAGPPRPEWEAFFTPNATNLVRSHLASFLLKPVPRHLTVQVTGLDPLAQTNGPLRDHFIELTGVDPLAPALIVVPTRTAVTDTNGTVTFTNLPPAGWRVRAKRAGYAVAEHLILSNPPPLLVVPVTLLSNALRVTLTSAYDPAEFLLYYNVPVTVQGLTNTGTAGLERVLNSRSLFDPPHQRFVTGLLPGMYRVSVNGTATTNNFYPVRPHFTGEDFVEVLPGETNNLTLRLDVAPAVVRGRLLAADELGDIELPGPFGPERKPIYRERAQAGLEFVEFAPDGLLASNRTVLAVDTDAGGEFTLHLLPARYGVRIPSMAGYWGSHARLTDLTANTDRAQGWPFATNWPFAGLPPANGTTNAGLPLVFLPNREYRLDLFVRKQQAYLRAQLNSELAIPTRFRVTGLDTSDPRFPVASLFTYFNELRLGGATATLTRGDGTMQTLPITRIRDDLFGSPAQVEFAGLTAGTNTLTVSAPRQTFLFFDPNTFDFTAPVFTQVIAPWRPPGVLPTSDPTAFDFVAPLTVVEALNGAAGFYQSPGTTVEWTVRYWNDFSMSYAFTETISSPDRVSFFEPAYAGGKTYAGRYQLVDIMGLPGLGGFRPPFPHGSFKCYLQFDTNWFVCDIPGPGHHTFEVFVGGPNNTANASPPAPTFDLALRAISAEDPIFLVPGTTVSIVVDGSRQSFPMNGATLGNFRGALNSAIVENPNWQVVATETEVLDPVTPLLRLTARLRRGTAFRGSVTNNATGEPLGGLIVRLLDRYGNGVLTLTNATNGAFVSPTALPDAQTRFAEVIAHGFYPWRRRFTPADTMTNPADTNTLLLVADARLEPLPPASVRIESVALDRFGQFLPGVRKAGALDATQQLTLTWRASVASEPVTITLPAFDAPDGTAPPDQSHTLVDKISEVWFVDPRSFPRHRYNDAPVPVAVPRTNDPAAVLAWLSRLRRGSPTNVPQQVLTGAALTESNAVFHAVGRLDLWKLPPGFLDPVMVAVSERGGVAVRTNGFYPTSAHDLEGVRLSPWMASVLNVLGVAAAARNNIAVEALQALVPEGRFLPLPGVEADITVSEEGFLLYAYAMPIAWKEGQDTPSSGLLALAPGVLGFDFEAGLAFGLDGQQRRAYLALGAMLGQDEIDGGRLLPKGLRKVGEVTFGGFINATNRSVQDLTLGDFELTHLVNGRVDLEAQFDLTPVLSKLPYIGPPLTLAKEMGVAEFYASLDAGVGMESVLTWQTFFPPPQETTTIDPDVNPPRRHFLGGREGLTTRTNSLALCFNFGAGLGVEAFGGNAGGSGKLKLTGNDCAGAPSVRVEPNELGDWPLIKRISGTLAAELELFAIVWGVEFRESLEWELIPIDHQFGTEAAFHLIPQNRIPRLTLPGNAPPVVFNSRGRSVVDGFFRGGSLAAGAGATCAMLFTDTDPVTGHMLLKVSLLGADGAWSAPVSLAAAGVILASDILQLPSGQWLAAWTQIAASDVGNPYPASSIHFALADTNGANWTAPGLIVALDDVADRLALFASPSLAGLAFTHTPDGPFDARHSLALAAWNGVAWSAPFTLVSNTPIARLSAVTGANPEAAVIAYAEVAGRAHTFHWDGAQIVGPQTASASSGHSLDLEAGADGRFRLALEQASGDIELLEYLPLTGWGRVAAVATNARPSDLRLTELPAGASNFYLFTWISAADAATLHYGFTDAAGQLLKPPGVLPVGTDGRLSDLHVLPAGDQRAKAVVRFHADTGSVQVLTLSLDDAPVLANPMRLAEGAFAFDLLGAPQRLYRVQISTNLESWLDLTNVLATNAVMRVLDSSAAGVPSRFYRAVQP